MIERVVQRVSVLRTRTHAKVIERALIDGAILIGIVIMVAAFISSIWPYNAISSAPLKTDRATYKQGDLITLFATKFCWDGTAYKAQPYITRSKILRQLPYTIHEGWTPEEAKILKDAPNHCVISAKGVPVAQVEIPGDARIGPHKIKYEITYQAGPFLRHTETLEIWSAEFQVTGSAPDAFPGR